MFESLKKVFTSPENEIKNPSSETDEIKIVKHLSNNDYEGAIVVGTTSGDDYWDYSGYDTTSIIKYQANMITMYRQLSKNQDVSNAVDQIVNEMTFTTTNEYFKINIDIESVAVSKKVSETFDRINKMLNIKKNLKSICRQLYIDGQLNVALVYDNNKIDQGIKDAFILEPLNLYFDQRDGLWKYDETNETESLYATETKDFDETYTKDELIHVDFGLTSVINLGDKKGKVNLSYLENAFRPANQLQTLENLLVPMRYNRSTSRRMFNIDVADLPPKQAKEVMDNIRKEFTYKKSYDTETGKIKHQKSTQPLVEDYWMSNRSGARGTTVDVMDEKGSEMGLEDIIHISRKLYSSLKIPSSRNPYIDENGGDFSFDSQDSTNEDLAFFLHVDQLRVPIEQLLKHILHRQLVATKVLTEKDWIKYEDMIDIQFLSKSIFLENMEKDLFIKSIGNWQDIKEDIGKVIPLEEAARSVFGWSSEQLKENLEKIKEEKSNPLYAAFYGSNEEGW